MKQPWGCNHDEDAKAAGHAQNNSTCDTWRSGGTPKHLRFFFCFPAKNHSRSGLVAPRQTKTSISAHGQGFLSTLNEFTICRITPNLLVVQQTILLQFYQHLRHQHAVIFFCSTTRREALEAYSEQVPSESTRAHDPSYSWRLQARQSPYRR